MELGYGDALVDNSRDCGALYGPTFPDPPAVVIPAKRSASRNPPPRIPILVIPAKRSASRNPPPPKLHARHSGQAQREPESRGLQLSRHSTSSQSR